MVIEVFIVAERDAVEQRPHVTDVRHRHPDLADLAPGELVVRVVAGLRRQVERDRQAGLPLGEVASGTARWTRPPTSARRRCASPRACSRVPGGSRPVRYSSQSRRGTERAPGSDAHRRTCAAASAAAAAQHPVEPAAHAAAGRRRRGVLQDEAPAGPPGPAVRADAACRARCVHRPHAGQVQHELAAPGLDRRPRAPSRTSAAVHVQPRR